jgi:hypothetical protein
LTGAPNVADFAGLPVLQLDFATVGTTLVGVVSASVLLGHKAARSTARDYLTPSDSEQSFVIDVLTLPTEEVNGKWFHGLAVELSEFAGRLTDGD